MSTHERIISALNYEYETQRYTLIDSILNEFHIHFEQAIVVTPTTGRPTLDDAIKSVQKQDYLNLVHLVVIDGQEYEEDVLEITSKYDSSNLKVICLPFNTGKKGFNGHRIYASISYLINSEYVFFLDEDNWFDEQHVSSLIDMIKLNKLDWAFSLRKIYSPNGTFVTEDNCESIGDFSPYSGRPLLVDTNCYAIRIQVLAKMASFWFHPLGADRYFFNVIRSAFPNYYSSSKYTLNYRLTEKKYPTSEFFIKGNDLMLKKYNQKLPWV